MSDLEAYANVSNRRGSGWPLPQSRSWLTDMAKRPRLGALVLAIVMNSAACSSTPPSAPSRQAVPSVPGLAPVRVLMLTATAAFRHDSIAAARDVMAALSAATGEFVITPTEDLSAIGATSLTNYDVVCFALTSGELPLSADEKSALLKFVTNGGGFIGVHSAADTLYEWPEYGGLVGAYFKEHPWTQQASVIVEEPSHPASAGLGQSFSLTEEFYTFRDNPRPRVQVLLRLDAESVGAAGDYPLAWAQTYGNGRAYYNALGHFSETWRDPRFQRQLAGAIRWAAGR